MNFKPGQRVRLNRELQMSGFAVPVESDGVVSTVHLQTSVLFDGFEVPLSVADSDIEVLAKSSKVASLMAETAFGSAFTRGDRVRLSVTLSIGGGVIPSGSLGTVTTPGQATPGSWVLFDGFPNEVFVADVQLANA